MAHGGLAWVRGEWARLRNNKLIANASTYISGSFIQRAFEFLLLPLWARFLSPGDYGIIGAMTSYATRRDRPELRGPHASTTPPEKLRL